MKIYLAGNNGMCVREREKLYALFFSRRLFSFFEVLPGRFCYRQWLWVKEEYH